MNTKSSYAKCPQCNELTWNDKWHNIYGKTTKGVYELFRM